MPGGYHVTIPRKEKDAIPSVLFRGEAGSDPAGKPGYREKAIQRGRQTGSGWSPQVIKEPGTKPGSNNDTDTTLTF